MQFLFTLLVFLVVLWTCFAAPGTISFATIQTEVEELDYKQVNLKVQRTGGSDGIISFICKILNSTQDDFYSHQSSDEFKNGETSSKSCLFYVKDDLIAEGNETLLVELSLIPGSNSSVQDPRYSYVKIIANDDGYGVVGFYLPDTVLLYEPRTAGGSIQQLPIQRHVGAFGPITVHWKVVSAGASSDITPTSGMVKFQNGDTKKSLEFSVRADTLIEQDEDFTFELTSVIGGARINTSQSKVAVRILANDIPVRFALEHIAVPENQSEVTVWIYRGINLQMASVDVVSSLSWYLRSGVARANVDFHQANGTVVFARGETKKSVTIMIIDDHVPEIGENFTVVLTNLSSDITLVSPSMCTIQILPSDDHVGVFKISGNVTISEDGGNNVANLTIERTAGSFGRVEITWRTTSNIGELSKQVQPTNGTVIFNNGVHYQSILIGVRQDLVPEEAFSFAVELTGVSDGRLTDDPYERTAEVKVRDSDDVYGVYEFADDLHQKLSLTTSPRMVHFIVNRHGGNLGTVAVNYETMYLLPDGSDRTSTMNISASGSVIMVPGQRNVSVSFTISQEGFIRANAVFRILLTSVKLLRPVQTLLPPQTPRLGARQTLNLTVHPQFADGEIGFAKTSLSVTEPEGVQPKDVHISVFRDGILYEANLLWSIVGVQISADVRPTKGSITFKKGVESVNITIQILPDSLPELDETFTLQLLNVSEMNQRLQSGSSDLILTILHNDNPGGTFQFDNLQTTVLYESSGSQFSVDVIRLGGDLDRRFVEIETTNDQNDFTPSEKKILLFRKGERRKTETYHVTLDNIPENNETTTFRLAPSGPLGEQGRLGNFTEFNVIILSNDDANGIIVFLNTSLSLVESKEDQKSVRFFLERQRGLFGDVAVSWNASSRGDSTLDISPTSGRVEFRSGEQWKTLQIFSRSDNIPEEDEHFILTLTQAEGGANIGTPRQATLTILRNDDAIEFASPTHVRIAEGNTVTFTILRKGRHNDVILVNYTTKDGSASSGDHDYESASQRVVFASGEVQKTISVSVLDDIKPESDENFTIVLTSSTGDTAIYGNTVAVVTIAASDDPNGIFHFDGNSLLNKTVKEKETVNFRVVRDRGIFGEVHVLWQVYQIFHNGSRVKLTSGDFKQTSGALVFENGTKTKDLVLEVLSDELAEYEEQFEVVLVNVTGGHPGPGGELSKNFTSANIQIPTNDHPYGLFAFSAKSLDVDVAEDTKPGFEYEAKVNLTVLRKRGTDRNVEVSWCIYKTDAVSNLGDIWDLVFLSRTVGFGVVERPGKKRPNTETKVLEFTGRNDSYAVVNALNKVLTNVMTISAWIQPKRDVIGTILAKVTTTSSTPYKLAINTKGNVTLCLTILSTGPRVMTACADINQNIFDGSWHNIMVSLNGGTGRVLFYYDGHKISTNSSLTFREILDGPGDLYVGASRPNKEPFKGMLQDVKIFTKAFGEGEIRGIADPVSELKPINGYLTYPQAVASRIVYIETVDNPITEDEKIFSMILVSSLGGADIDDFTNSRARITVLKSDNANGLFEFSSDQTLSKTVAESFGNISVDVERTLGVRGQVIVEWEITNVNGARATEDFDSAFGSLVFSEGEKKKTLIVSVKDDARPELLERFTLRLVSAQSNDRKKESSPTSGSSINPGLSECNITIEENDAPYGLLQFSGSPPENGSIAPLMKVFKLQTRESVGDLKFYIVRAQGTLGNIQCSWKIVGGTAIAGTDYINDARTVTFVEGETSVAIAISIKDNDKPELNKTFRVELYGEKNGAQIGPGGVAVVTILPSDDAFGVVNFTSSSLLKVVQEGQDVKLELQRTGGALGPIDIVWEISEFGYDFVERSGQVSMDTNQRRASFLLTVIDDLLPELSESFLLHLSNVSNGRLASRGTVANITVLANDDPHGVFEFDPILLSVEEADTNVTLMIVRRKGTVGKTRVYYTSVPSSVLVEGLKYRRADENKDYRSINGFVDFQPNQTSGSIVISVMDDVIPEDNETVIVNLTSVVLMSDSVVQPGVGGSPRIGKERLGQVIILRNDNASGIVHLSSSTLTIGEDHVGSFLSVVRSVGTFGEVKVDIEVTSLSAKINEDYHVNSSSVIIQDGQRIAFVPIVVINDDDPEFDESFIIRLLSKDGSVLVGSPAQCTVTIQENDYPYGLLGFSDLSMNKFVTEPSSGKQSVNLDVIREYGTRGVVRFQWEVTHHGRLATNDVEQTKGESLIPPGENETSIVIVVLADNVPEVNEVLLVTLNVTQGKAKLNPDRRQVNVTILLNDEARGVIEFAQDSYTVEEKDQNTVANISIVRKRGTYGDVRVYYSTSQGSSSFPAIPDQDYTPVSNASATIADGSNVSAVSIVIIGDSKPEFSKYFNVILERVELINLGGSSKPRIGPQSQANITIEDDDHVYGLFKVFVIDPKDDRNRSRVVVNETDGLAITFVVQRFGGDLGVVTVEWIISPESTASTDDFDGSGSIFRFNPGQRQKDFTLTIASDDIPERDETIIVKLVRPTGGASVAPGTGNNATVVILANDVVAGKIGFSTLSRAVVVDEGQLVVLSVIRTAPAAGRVTTEWVIQGDNVTKDFNETNGLVQFNEGENMTFIKTLVLPDNTSEVDEQFQVILSNPVTLDVSWTGAAEIDDRSRTATVTIAASDEPHGVVEFQQSSRRVTVKESEKFLELSVARLFGNIGKIRVHFIIINGSIQHLRSDERLAVANKDVNVNNSFITIENGIGIGIISINIINDNLAELDEFFLVNITSVELVHPPPANNATFTPPRLGRYLTSEVKIEENDGPYGILVFSPSRVSVYENITVFNLTVRRTQGTYGDIQVSYFIRKMETIQENDFHVYGNLEIGGENTLKFVNGQRTQNITVFVYDDNRPEGDETFEVKLKNPRGSSQLGKESVAKVTILVSDGGNGIFKFDGSSLHKFVDEPGSQHVGTTKARFTVLRENGTIGVVVIKWSVRNHSASLDLRAANGTVTFKDGEREKSFVVETVVDEQPEKKESFLVVLSVLSGGGEVMPPSQAWLTVSENDAPYGEFGFAVAPNVLTIEETVGYTELKVIRHKGTYGQATVNYQTTSTTADGSSGDVVKFGTFQGLRTRNAQTWYPFSAYGQQYLLLGASNGSISSNHGNEASYISSSLFRWQGIYTHVSKIKTNNAVQWESFNINDQHYIAVANHGTESDHEVNSTIYKLNQNGTMDFHQNILTQAASNVKFFQPSGSSSSYLIFSNMKNNVGNTVDVQSKVYLWSNVRFIQHGPGLNCRGASGLALFTINNRDMLSISSFFDSVNKNYQSKSVVFEWKNQKFESVQEISTNGATGVEYFKIGNDDFLLFINSFASPSLYKWSGAAFRLHRDLLVSNTKAVKEFTMHGEVYLAVTSLYGSSQLLKWNSPNSNFQHYTNITESDAVDVQPITVQDAVVHNVTLLAVAMTGSSQSRLLQPAMVSPKADFIPRNGQLIFEDGDTELSIFVTIFNDSVSEPDESFMVSLSNATGGSIVGPDKYLKVQILSNGNPYGRIEFSKTFIIVEEKHHDSKVYLEVLREQGRYGEVVVAWNSIGNVTGSHGDGADVSPTSGEVVFLEGETRKTINLTIFADDIPELNEVLFVRLTHLKKDGSDLPGLGATINTAQDLATIVIKSNDEPHGIVGWRRTVVLAQESEAINSTVQLVVERRLGTFGDIEISYATVEATSNSSSNERPAVPYQDFIPVDNQIVMANGVNVTTISLNVIHDDNAEVNEIFFVNITSVRLLLSYNLLPQDSPRISPSSQTAKVVISENDNKRGELNFNVSHLLDPRTGILRINENIGVLSLQVVRSSGVVGRVGFEYRLVAETPNKNDYFPVKGQIIFNSNVVSRVLEINVTDDAVAEVAERFRVEMTLPIGGAKLGNDREVSVEIRASDQPYGVFEFSNHSPLAVEEGHEVHVMVTRLQGSFRQVRVYWNLSTGAFPDFSPANGTLTFDINVTSQVIKLKARDNDIPEGDNVYMCYLVLADNGGVIGSENSVTLRIDANDDGYGVMAIDPATSFVFVGEPNLPSYNGEVTISVVRNAGTYGEVVVDWEITSDDLVVGKTSETFNMTHGTLVFGDGVKVRNVTLQVKQDSYPEETGNYTFSLTGTRDARIDQSSSKAIVVVVSSDHPYGVIEFVGDATRNVSEDVGHVTLNVVRHKGHIGRLLVTINVTTNDANEGRDFQITPKVLTIDDEQDDGSFNVTILSEDIPELSESFTVSLGNIELVTSKPVNYGYKNGLQVDMPPVVGTHSNVVITVGQNDDPHGVIEFKERRKVVHEYDKNIVITIIRSGGAYGRIQARYTVTNLTAQYGQDYRISDGTITIDDGMQMRNLTIPLLDDAIPEDKETFQLDLISVDGGARLGTRRTLLIVIETSDNPDGLFGFINQSRLTFNNPNATQVLNLGVSRIGGARSPVEVKIRVFKTFPNQDTVTVDVYPESKDLSFPVNELGPKIFKLSILPFIEHREVEEHFVVTITEVSGNASIDSLTSNVTVVILKHGIPNGLFGFQNSASQVVSESRSGPVMLTVERHEGRKGIVEVKWVVLGSSGAVDDFVSSKGTLVFLPNDERKQISLTIVDDAIPELDEKFTISLLVASGGGEINKKTSNATIIIRASDNPHGAFGLRSNTQRITVEDNLSRTLSFTVERTGGRFGAVQLKYNLEYPEDKVKPLKGYVTLGNGEVERTQTVVLDDGAFLLPGSHFTLTFTDVSYQGSGVSDITPTLIPSASSENIQVPNIAANSIVKFKDGYTTLLVNQDNQVSRVFVSRRGLYGDVTVFISDGYPDDKYSGFTKGVVKPSVSQVKFTGNEVEKEFSVQVTPLLVPNGKFIYSIYLSRVSTSPNVRGGSSIDKENGTAIIEGGGVIVVAIASQKIVTKENQAKVAITVYRLFSSLGTTNVIYSTQANTATPSDDYVEKKSSQFSMLEGEYTKVINIDMKNDDVPELAETFVVNITGVTGANVRLGKNTTSTITIQDDDSPHGILSFKEPSLKVSENITTVDVVVHRSGGTFGNVGVQVRTVGGGESWNAGGSEIENILSRRNKSSVAEIVSDYDMVDIQVNFPDNVSTPSHGQNQIVKLTIKNDAKPERDEDIYLYLLNPSGGAVLASPSSKNPTWTIVTIEGNDLMNGKIGFKTTSLTMNEDENLKVIIGEIIVERTQSLGTAKVKWEALDFKDEFEISTGVIVFHPDEASTTLVIQLKQDNKPELQMHYTVKLVSLVNTREAIIDPARNVVNITVLPSDDPAGLIAFDQDSRNVAVDSSSKTIELIVTREQGVNGNVEVSYKTIMLPERYTDDDVVINRAIENKDYSMIPGNLVFEAGKRTSDAKIVIDITQNSDSSSSYPKAFNVTLFNVLGGARLSDQFSTIMVIISNEVQTTQFLKLRSDSLKTPLSNYEMTSVLRSLHANINQATLSDSHISIVINAMNNILDDLARRSEDKQLTSELSKLFMSTFDIFLNPERTDFGGKTQLTEPFVKYAFSLVLGRPCPDTSVVGMLGKFAMVQGRRRLQHDINGLILASSSGKNTFTYPSNIYLRTNQTSSTCEDVHFIEYLTSHWFNKDDKKDILNDRVLSTSVKNDSETNLNKGSSTYKIYAADRRVTPKGAECLKWRDELWDNTICSVKKESDDFVECECRHFSNFAVRAQSDDRVGYQFYFYIAAFICMISFFLVILSHHICSIENTFSSKLLMHMFFAGFALHLLIIVAAYVTPGLTDKPTQCAALGILIHYFLLAHFCWIFVQCCNLWRILVLNDEHTERKFILYFMIGWGIPLVFVALYIIVTHASYDWGVTDIYADVHNNGDMCFIRNTYGALASIVAPVLLFLLGVCVVATQAYQVTLQWKLYDDIFRGHHNIKEVIHLWVVFVGITLTWLFGGLHLAYGKLWLAIVFSIFELLTGLYVFMVYFILRNQCRKKYRNETYLRNTSSPSMLNGSPTDYYTERPVMYDTESLHSSRKSDLRISPPNGNEWEEYEYDGTTPKESRREYADSPLAQVNPLYDEYHGKKDPDMSEENMEEEELSQDFSNLIYALKTGEDIAKEDPINIKELETMRTDQLELRRQSIADTHV